MTEWKTIPGFDNYECTASGLLRRKAHEVAFGAHGKTKMLPVAMLSPSMCRHGHRMTMVQEGVQYTVTPYRAIYETWVGKVPDRYAVVQVERNEDFSVNNLKLKLVGTKMKRAATETRKLKLSASYRRENMEGFCALMGRVLSSPLRDNPQWSHAWQ